MKKCQEEEKVKGGGGNLKDEGHVRFARLGERRDVQPRRIKNAPERGERAQPFSGHPGKVNLQEGLPSYAGSSEDRSK